MEQREGSGILFQNQKKSPNHPDWKGEALVNGVMVQIAGWVKLTKKGDEFISLKIEEKREERQQERPAPKPASKFDDLKDDIPF